MYIKRVIFRYLSFILMLNMFLPIVSQNLPGFIFGYKFNLLLWFSALFFLHFKTLFCKPMLIVFVYILLYYIIKLIGQYDIDLDWFYQNISPILLAISMYNYFLECDRKTLPYITSIILIFILVTSISSSIGNIWFPGASRGLSGPLAKSGLFHLVKMYQNMGIASYGFFSGIAFLFPCLYYQYKNLRKNRNYWFILIIFLFISSFLAGFTIPILISMFAIVISAIGYKRLKRNYFITFLIILLFLMPNVFYSQMFYFVSGLAYSEELETRLHDIGLAFEQGVDTSAHEVTEVEHRMTRFSYNINIFMENVILGSGKPGNSHLYWLNILAQFGLVGLIPVLIVIISQIKFNLKIFDKSYKFYYLLSFILFTVSGIMKAVAGKEMFFYLFFVIPSIYYMRYLKKFSRLKTFNKYIGD